MNLNMRPQVRSQTYIQVKRQVEEQMSPLPRDQVRVRVIHPTWGDDIWSRPHSLMRDQIREMNREAY